jgi:hypothetical protein
MPLARTPLSPGSPARAACALLLVLAGACSSADKGPKGIVPGMALGKMCHELNRGGAPVTLTLQFGDPPITSITAITGKCAPMPGTACTSIPIGKVPIKLFEGDKLLTSRDVVLYPEGHPPTEYVFQPVVAYDNTGRQVVAVTGGRIAPGTCRDLDFPGPDAGVTDAGDAATGEAGGVEAGTEGGAPDAGADLPAAVDVETDVGAPDVAADTAAPAPDTAAD